MFRLNLDHLYSIFVVVSRNDDIRCAGLSMSLILHMDKSANSCKRVINMNDVNSKFRVQRVSIFSYLESGARLQEPETVVAPPVRRRDRARATSAHWLPILCLGPKSVDESLVFNDPENVLFVIISTIGKILIFFVLTHRTTNDSGGVKKNFKKCGIFDTCVGGRGLLKNGPFFKLF